MCGSAAEPAAILQRFVESWADNEQVFGSSICLEFKSPQPVDMNDGFSLRKDIGERYKTIIEIVGTFIDRLASCDWCIKFASPWLTLLSADTSDFYVQPRWYLEATPGEFAKRLEEWKLDGKCDVYSYEYRPRIKGRSIVHDLVERQMFVVSKKGLSSAITA